MSKIEEYQAKKRIAGRMRGDVLEILGKDSPNNDKHMFRASFSCLNNEQWSPMIFSVFAYHGYYGSSSGYSNTSKELGEYLARAISIHGEMLLNSVVAMAEAEAEKARKEAEAEANVVLKETAA